MDPCDKLERSATRLKEAQDVASPQPWKCEDTCDGSSSKFRVRSEPADGPTMNVCRTIGVCDDERQVQNAIFIRDARNTTLPADALAVVEECRRLREALVEISGVKYHSRIGMAADKAVDIAERALNSGSAATDE